MATKTTNLSHAFADVKRKIEQTKDVLPKIIANQAQNYFVMSWRNQGFDGNKWQEVRRRVAGTNEYKYPIKKGLSRRTRPILIGKTGRLRRKVANSVVLANWNMIKLLVDLPYAAVHNEGTANTPKREFMGQTAELTRMQRQRIDSFFDQIWDINKKNVTK
jgi:phage gpG-like protein